MFWKLEISPFLCKRECIENSTIRYIITVGLSPVFASFKFWSIWKWSQPKIRVIEAILASPDKYPDETQQERFEKLKEKFPEDDCLFTYFRFTEHKLQDQLNKLQVQWNELQKEKNLLQEEKLKMMTASAGNHLNDCDLNELILLFS